MLANASDSKKLQTGKAANLNRPTRSLRAIEKGEFEYESIRGAKKGSRNPSAQGTGLPGHLLYDQYRSSACTRAVDWFSCENPLAARVAVNHVWMRHFGTPLVETVFDFGLRAKRPLHTELLDSLAVELMESGWSLQHLHRLIVTSQAYRLGSSVKGCDPVYLGRRCNESISLADERPVVWNRKWFATVC